MSAGVTVRGAANLERTARAAAAELRNLAATNARVAGQILAAAHPPVRTGRLRASGGASSDTAGATVTWPVPYAGVVEHRTGFAAAALAAAEAPALDTYAAAVNDAVGAIRGT